MKNIGIGLVIVIIAALCGSLHSQPNDTGGIGNKIVYVEYQAEDLAKTRKFFERTFGWNFSEPAPTYVTFFDGRMAGGFTKSSKVGTRETGGGLISIYSDNIEETQRKVVANGGKIVEAALAVPGGRRFVFTEPSGNEFAVVSSK